MSCAIVFCEKPLAEFVIKNLNYIRVVSGRLHGWRRSGQVPLLKISACVVNKAVAEIGRKLPLPAHLDRGHC
ncbi:hypothetical protein SDC9_164570 [bioreactor metagenome]|uniref:Uncharacterized protein n=1 Tax=bioreactor metagenome TaxID=1076179 RepID=A0A645FTH2_9ZZZZ